MVSTDYLQHSTSLRISLSVMQVVRLLMTLRSPTGISWFFQLLHNQESCTGPFTVCLSPLTMELVYWFFFPIQLFVLWFIAVWVIFPSPCWQHSFRVSYEVDFFSGLCHYGPGVLPASRKVDSLRFEEDEYIPHERIQKLVDWWIDGCFFLHISAGTTERMLQVEFGTQPVPWVGGIPAATGKDDSDQMPWGRDCVWAG